MLIPIALPSPEETQRFGEVWQTVSASIPSARGTSLPVLECYSICGSSEQSLPPRNLGNNTTKPVQQIMGTCRFVEAQRTRSTLGPCLWLLRCLEERSYKSTSVALGTCI